VKFNDLTSKQKRAVYGIGIVVVLLFGLAFCGHAHSADLAAPAATADFYPINQVNEPVTIPQTAYLYRFKLQREAISRFGSADPVARIGAQVHAESRWRADAHSAYAQGMAEFTPDTAEWMRSICPDIGPPDAWDPNWSVRAVTCYDHYLHEHVAASATPCDQWAFTLSAYNGGLGWVSRDRARASSAGLDSDRWFGNVERASARSTSARTENRNYVSQILLKFEPAYIAAGWPGQKVCT
jgi:hypothetical protein